MFGKSILWVMNKKAFTIIEILVIIAVIIILISLIVPRLRAMQDNGTLAKTKKETQIIASALESYYAFNLNHVYPPSTITLQATYLINASPKVVGNIVYDPFVATGTTEYNYLSSLNGKYYIVFSAGLTGQNQPIGVGNDSSITY